MNLVYKVNLIKENVNQLAVSIETNVTTIDDLVGVLTSYQSFKDDDPIPHIIAAMNHYVIENKELQK